MSRQTITIRPGYHKCPESGIGSATMTFALADDGWGAEFEVITDWGLPDEEFKAASPDCTHIWHQKGYPSRGKPMGALVRWHGPEPHWEGQDASVVECQITDGVCYADVGYLIGNDGLKVLLTGGSDAVWAWLQGLVNDARESQQAAS